MNDDDDDDTADSSTCDIQGTDNKLLKYSENIYDDNI